MLRLDDIADNIAAAATLSAEDRSHLMLRCLSVMAALALPTPSETPVTTAHTTPDADPLLSVEQAAGRLAFRPSYVYELVRSRQLPAVKVGKYVRIKASDVGQFIKHHREAGPIDRPVSSMLSNLNGRTHGGSRGQAPARIVGSNPGRPRAAAGSPCNDRQPLGAGLRLHTTTRRSTARAVGRAETRPEADQEGLNRDGEDLEA